ncbi:hypothetical protein [Piscinibacter sp. XHJ-5]|uniref:hypothetical protein n=1 Tax=Piscinibacter sp. XHJ-5 TaxID=3037797 RepID=UPI0024533223|nr:hypothetical protein [Piscinibacter sp. XHJ-5]
MHLQVPIAISDELDEHIVDSVPAAQPDYAFTSGKLSHAGKHVEFSVQVDPFSGRYSVTANELLDIKVRAVARLEE